MAKDAQIGEIERSLKKLNDQRWDRRIDRIIDAEGRDVLTDKPDDEGGPTKSGITRETYKNWRRDHGGENLTDGQLYAELRNLHAVTAREILGADYLEQFKIDQIPDFDTAAHVLDAVVIPGSGRAIRWVMGELNAMYDAHCIDMPPLKGIEAIGPEVSGRIWDAKQRGLLGVQRPPRPAARGILPE